MDHVEAVEKVGYAKVLGVAVASVPELSTESKDSRLSEVTEENALVFMVRDESFYYLDSFSSVMVMINR